jgi:hypothetical protein
MFWQNLKRDYENNALDCYEARLEEIVFTNSSIDRKYWKTQKGIASRRKRTELFRSNIFDERRQKHVAMNVNFRYIKSRFGSFNHRVLYQVRQDLIRKQVINLKE